MTDPVIWAPAKKTIRLYFGKLQTEHGLSTEEITYDVFSSEDMMVIFTIHKTLKGLLESEIKKRSIKKSYHIAFSPIDEATSTCQMKLEAGGYESYIFAGMLNGIVSDLDEIKKEKIAKSKGAILSTICEVLVAMNIKSKFSPGLKENKGCYYVSLTFKDFDWKAIPFENADVLQLIADIAKKLPAMIKKRQEQQ